MPSETPNTSENPPQGPKILIVDDHLEGLALEQIMLQEALGCEVCTASDGLMALEVARTERPDIILLDVHLPDMDGFAVLECLLKDPLLKNIRVLLLTGEARSLESKVRGLQMGAYDYLLKPIDPHELIARIEVALRLKRAEEDLRREQGHTAYLEGVLTTVRTLQHSVNNPLQALLGNIELLERLLDEPSPEARTRIARIREAGQRIANFTHQIGRVTHVETTDGPVGEMLDLDRITPSPNRKES